MVPFKLLRQGKYNSYKTYQQL